MGNRNGEAFSHEKFGTMCYCLGEYDKAKENLDKAHAIRVEIGDRKGEAADYGKLGVVLESLREYGKAK